LLSILQAMLRLARRRDEAGVEALAVRVGGTQAQVRAALVRLDRAGWVIRGPERARLTMAGFALAVATLPARPMVVGAGRRARAA
jgi:DNA-binding IclR family transcriptional regulator